MDFPGKPVVGAVPVTVRKHLTQPRGLISTLPVSLLVASCHQFDCSFLSYFLLSTKALTPPTHTCTLGTTAVVSVVSLTSSPTVTMTTTERLILVVMLVVRSVQSSCVPPPSTLLDTYSIDTIVYGTVLSVSSRSVLTEFIPLFMKLSCQFLVARQISTQ